MSYFIPALFFFGLVAILSIAYTVGRARVLADEREDAAYTTGYTRGSEDTARAAYERRYTADRRRRLENCTCGREARRQASEQET